jgi:hypothetical protein
MHGRINDEDTVTDDDDDDDIKGDARRIQQIMLVLGEHSTFVFERYTVRFHFRLSAIWYFIILFQANNESAP